MTDKKIAPVHEADAENLPHDLKALIASVAEEHVALARNFAAIGRKCLELDNRRGKIPRSEIVRAAGMDQSSFSRYVSVGRLPENLICKLPNMLRILAGVASLDKEALAAAEADGLLNSDLTIKQLENWKRERSGRPPRPQLKNFASVIEPNEPDLTAFAREQLQNLMAKGVEVVFTDEANSLRKQEARVAKDLQIVRDLEARYGVRAGELNARIEANRKASSKQGSVSADARALDSQESGSNG